MPQLAIHVINSGIGESIVVQLPNDKWGVVDCYASSLADTSSNPTLKFLHDNDVTELEFLCLTHPHFDHYRGLSHLLDSFKVRYFWRFGAFSSRDLKSIFLKYMKASARESDDRDILEEADELTQVLAKVVRRQKEGDISDIFLLSDVKPLYPLPHGSDEDMEIKSIAPSSNHCRLPGRPSKML